MRLRHFLVSATVLGAMPATASPLAAQSLRGSTASVERMYAEAQQSDLLFFSTARSVQAAVAVGELVSLESNGHYTLQRVRYPYVLPATRDWVLGFATRYHAACGEPLVITSGSRPLDRQPRNSSPKSVHPTGMAVDLRKPRGRCLKWLRNELLQAERSGELEATEERRPAHFHVAVFPNRVAQPVRVANDVFEAEGEDEARDEAVRSSSMTEAPHTPALATVQRVDAESKADRFERYRVRRGDTLWELARRKDTTIKHLQAINKLRSSRIVPGQTLLLPAGQ